MQDAELDHAASHLGKAVGITTLLRGTVYHAQRRRIYLPSDLMAKEGVSEDQLTRGEPSEGLNNVVFEVASAAKVNGRDELLKWSVTQRNNFKPVLFVSSVWPMILKGFIQCLMPKIAPAPQLICSMLVRTQAMPNVSTA